MNVFYRSLNYRSLKIAAVAGVLVMIAYQSLQHLSASAQIHTTPHGVQTASAQPAAALAPEAAPASQYSTSSSRSKNPSVLSEQVDDPRFAALALEAEPIAIVGSVKLLRETAAQPFISDQPWDEDATVEAQRELEAEMTAQQWANDYKINDLEAQLFVGDTDESDKENLLDHMEQVLVMNDTADYQGETNRRLLDLQCSTSLCKVSLDVADDHTQLDIMENFPSAFDWVEEIFAEVRINDDYRRTLTFYLTRKPDSDNQQS